MIFLCFSGRDRTKIITSILYHLENHGFKTWFDNHQYIIGDNKVDKYTDAINTSEYAIVLFSKDFPNSPGAIEELDVIKERHKKGKIHIFPIFYNILANKIPYDYQWLCDMIYNELNDKTGTLLTCNQIVCKYYDDYIIKNNYKPISNYIKLRHYNYPPFSYITKLIDVYTNISKANINSRMSLLYCLLLFLFEQDNGDLDALKKSANYLFDTTKLNLTYNFKEIQLLEQICVISLGRYFNKHHQEF